MQWCKEHSFEACNSGRPQAAEASKEDSLAEANLKNSNAVITLTHTPVYSLTIKTQGLSPTNTYLPTRRALMRTCTLAPAGQDQRAALQHQPGTLRQRNRQKKGRKGTPRPRGRRGARKLG